MANTNELHKRVPMVSYDIILESRPRSEWEECFWQDFVACGRTVPLWSYRTPNNSHMHIESCRQGRELSGDLLNIKGHVHGHVRSVHDGEEGGPVVQQQSFASSSMQLP